jgi:hypothetical protein
LISWTLRSYEEDLNENKKAPTNWGFKGVGERLEISNFLREDLSDVKSLIDEHIMISKK